MLANNQLLQALVNLIVGCIVLAATHNALLSLLAIALLTVADFVMADNKVRARQTLIATGVLTAIAWPVFLLMFPVTIQQSVNAGAAPAFDQWTFAVPAESDAWWKSLSGLARIAVAIAVLLVFFVLSSAPRITIPLAALIGVAAVLMTHNLIWILITAILVICIWMPSAMLPHANKDSRV